MATRTVVFLSQLKPGGEQQLIHDLPTDFPSQALSKIEGIKRVTICQGNGLFAAVVEYDGDFERVFADYISSPAIQAFHYKIQSLFQAPPISADPSKVPLAGDVFVWDGKQFKTAVG